MKEIVTFFLSGRQYGVEIGNMQGIENFANMTHTPDMPECLQGIVVIRNELIPVVDIRRRMTLPVMENTKENKFVLLRSSKGKLAIVVDEVAQIAKAEDQEIQPFPALLMSEATSYADYIVKNKNQLVLVLNPNKILTEEEWADVKKVLEDVKTGGKDD